MTTTKRYKVTNNYAAPSYEIDAGHAVEAVEKTKRKLSSEGYFTGDMLFKAELLPEVSVDFGDTFTSADPEEFWWQRCVDARRERDEARGLIDQLFEIGNRRGRDIQEHKDTIHELRTLLTERDEDINTLHRERDYFRGQLLLQQEKARQETSLLEEAKDLQDRVLNERDRLLERAAKWEAVADDLYEATFMPFREHNACVNYANMKGGSL